MSSIFYSPKNAAVGDVIPCFMNGEFKVFYLQLSRAKNPVSYTHLTLPTSDLV